MNRNLIRNKKHLAGKFLLSVFILIITFSRCARNDTNSTSDSFLNGLLYTSNRSFDSSSIFINLSKNIILKNYTDLVTNGTTFKSAVDGYTQSCGNTAALQNLQTLWKSNVYALKLVEIVQFGPAVQGGYYEIIDPWGNSYLSNPPDTASINTFIAGSTTIDTSNVSSLNKLQRGLPAIEYLLFDDGTGNSSLASICTNLTGRRLSFLTYLVADYYTNIVSLKNAWSENGGNFVNELATAGLGSSFFETKKAALDSLITQMVTVLNNIVDKKLGYPAGLNVSSNGTIRSTSIESRYGDASVDCLVANLISIQTFYNGNGGTGISDYVRATNPIIDRKISAQIDDAIAKMKLISNLRTSLLASDLTKIREAYDSIKNLRTTLTTDLSALSGTGTVTSTGDGD